MRHVNFIVAGLLIAGEAACSAIDGTRTWPNAPTGLAQRIGICAGWFWFATLAVWQWRARRQTWSTPLVLEYAPAAGSAVGVHHRV